MSEFQPYYTNDGSVGLYSENYNDIYHSASGALTEAYEKFISPINWDILLSHDDINILDICYGIGYNTKSFLNYILENKKKLFFQKKIYKNNSKNITTNKLYIDTIHTNNISEKNIQIYNDTIHTDNIFNSISVTAIDNDEILLCLSPFIKTGVNHFKNDNKVLQKLGIEKYYDNKNIKFPKINKIINYQILSKITQKYPKICQNPQIASILASNKYKRYLSNDLMGLYNFLLHKLQSSDNCFNLHNIYYRYISYCNKIALKYSNLQDFNFEVKIDDARNALKNDNNMYNLIFLDAFTPAKCPCLWTYDFFKRLYEILDDDGMLLTYSSAAVVRSAMKAAGFEIGNIFIQRLNKYQGTIAVKNSALIKYPLSEADLGLLNTKAGIFYRDKNLNAQNESIISAHKIEVENSERISSSQYLKLRRKNVL